MTKDQLTALRAELLTLCARLLDHAAQQADVDPHSWGWLHMVGDVQLALQALDEAPGCPSP